MTYRFAHVNFNVCDLAKSIAFYEQALGLKEIRRLSGQRRSEDGGDYVIVYLGDDRFKKIKKILINFLK